MMVDGIKNVNNLLRILTLKRKCLTSISQLPRLAACEGFDPLRAMEAVFANKRSITMVRFGFVRFKNVKDSAKMIQAIRNDWFGKFRTWAYEARFGK